VALSSGIVNSIPLQQGLRFTAPKDLCTQGGGADYKWSSFQASHEFEIGLPGIHSANVDLEKRTGWSA
jgi:hypothetical protein